LAQLQVARPQLWSLIATGAENIATIATTWNGIITIAGAGVRCPVVVTDRHWCREHRYYRYDLECIITIAGAGKEAD
jgi:hypothetical protein